MAKKNKKLAREIARLRALYGEGRGVVQPEESPSLVSSPSPQGAPAPEERAVSFLEEEKETAKPLLSLSLVDVLRRDLLFLGGIVILSLVLLFGLNYLILKTPVGNLLLSFFKLL